MKSMRPFHALQLQYNVTRNSNKIIQIQSFRRAFSGSAKTHFERRRLPYPATLVYSVISDVKSYDKFVPWCKKSEIVEATVKGFEAELTIGFSMFEEKYISDVTLVPGSAVKASSTKTTLLEYLHTEWTVSPTSDQNSCWVSFKLDFKFKSTLYSQVSDLFFDDIVKKMVQAFDTRCKSLTSNK